MERIELPPHVPKTRTLPLRYTEKYNTIRFFSIKSEIFEFAESILKLAPQVGIEPTTNKLTACCTTAVLLWNISGGL